MAYTPIGWQTGDTITAELMNKMDNGWSVETTSTTPFDGSVTTTGEGGYFAALTLTEELSTTVGDTAIITFNGTSYTCTCLDVGCPAYGAPVGDFSTYPFNLFHDGVWIIATESAGTYTLKIEAVSETVEVSDDFATASQTAVADVLPLNIEFGTTTWQEVYDAMETGQIVFVYKNGRTEPVIYANSSGYSIICLSYSSGNLTTSTYCAYPSSADSPIVEH